MRIVCRLSTLWFRNADLPACHGHLTAGTFRCSLAAENDNLRPGLLIGYARVSTSRQKLDLQIDALRLAGCDLIYREIASGRDTARPRLAHAITMLRSGDVLLVWSLDRLSRCAAEVMAVIEAVRKRGANVRVLLGERHGIGTETPEGRLLLSVLACMAEFEVEMTSARTRAGIRSADRRMEHRSCASMLSGTFNGASSAGSLLKRRQV
jgi:predicted site-specific integrase-resolvase